MALSRRFTQRATDNIWPGFVDAMTALLLVLMFVLTIFMVIQSVLSERILDQDTELDELTLQLSDLADALGMERTRAEELTGEVGQLTATLDEAKSDAAAQQALIATLTATVSTQRAEIASQGAEIANQSARIAGFEDQVAALLSRAGELEVQAAQLGDTLAASEEDRAALQATLADTEAARDRALSEADALNLALAKLRTEVDAEAENARLAAARADAFESLVKDLESRNAAREGRLATLLAQLEQADAAAKARSAELEEQSVSTAALQEELAAALSNLSAAEEARLSELAKSDDLKALLASREFDLSESEKMRLAEAAAAEALRKRLSDQETALTEAEKNRLAELAAADALRERLKNSDAELTAMTLALEERRREAEETLTLLAAEQAARSRLEGDLDSLTTEREALAGELSEAEKAAALLAVANLELEKFEAQSAEDARRVALLNEQVAALRTQLGGLQSMLDDATAKDVEAQVQIQALGSQLNTALARVASEQRARADLEEAERRRLEAESEVLKADAEQLALYRSEFFGRLRDLLGGQEGVRIEGDRFVFSSEVLFDRGEVALSLQGRQEIAKVAAILRRIAGEIPAELDWVIRVDGHTDDIPVTGGRFQDNWELSQGRALSVVRYMINQLGIPPDRLVAAGFGEFNPINTEDSEEARAQNRRIELKFTEK
jgi:chemotaxis protein MotB